ncbi:MAG: hypothetical protein C4308_09455 [Chitinophagaceae bacterium]
MKKLLLFSALLTGFVCYAQETKQLKKVLELPIPREGGVRAAQVAWHPLQKKYYAAMAGNTSFCLAVFDIKGKRLTPSSQETMFDIRGLWYNPNKKTLQMNGYNDFGWAEYKLDAKGFPTSAQTLFDGMNQPSEQSVGAFEPKSKQLYFFDGEGALDYYDASTATYTDKLPLHLGITEADDDGSSSNVDVYMDYNYTTVVYTGMKKAEFGLLNFNLRQIELYNAENGYLTKIYTLPDDAPAEDMLCFSYANGIFWLFDRNERIWKGYK